MKGQFLVGNCKGFQGVSLNRKLMNWWNCRSKEGDPPSHPNFDLQVIELHSGFTLNSRRLTGSLRPNTKQVTSKHSTLRSDFKIWNEKGARVHLSQEWFHQEHVVWCCMYLSLVWWIFWTCYMHLELEAKRYRTTFVSQERMASAGRWHTVLLRSDGQAVACGSNFRGQCSIPRLHEGLSYSQVSAGDSHTVLLRSDGQAVACGLNSDGQCSLPPLDEGVSYSQVSAAGLHTVLLRSDGQAVACGFYSHGKDGIPPLAGGLSYIQVSAGEYHTVLLRSDGQAVACGSNSDGKCSIPPLDEGLAYSQVSAGASHTVLLRSDGQAVACGSNSQGQCSIPPVDEGLSYIQACAGEYHTVLLRSDGEAVACGRNSEGQCSIPPLDEGLSYSQVSGGGFHTVLLRSDGQAVACGKNSDGRCNIPSLMSWRDWLPFGFASPSYRYICDSTSFAMLGKDRVVQVDFFLEGDAGVILTCVGLDGLEVLRLKAQKSNRTVDVCMRVARELNTNVENLRMILPDARLLATICKANPFATLSDVISVWAKMASIRGFCQNACVGNVLEFHPYAIP